MRLFPLRLVLAPLVLSLGTLAGSFAPVASAADCQFVLGFATLHSLVPNIVGQCLDDEQHSPASGDALQGTTGGLLVWRKADNLTAFTNGYQTWINGPNGLEPRLNSQRFSWEPNPTGLPIAPDVSVAQQPISTALTPSVTITNADAGNTINVSLETVISVSLTAGSGMENWHIDQPDPAVLTPIVNPAATVTPGVTLTWFKVVGTGTAMVSASDRPSCQPGSVCPQFIQAFSVSLVVS